MTSTCTVNGLGQTINGMGVCTATGNTTPPSIVTVTTSGTGVSGNDNHAQPGGGHDLANGDVTYYFEVDGLATGTAVPMFIYASLQAHANMLFPYPNSAANASAALGVSNGISFTSLAQMCSGVTLQGHPLICAGTDFTGALAFTAYSGYVGFVDMFISLETLGGSTAADASIDPYIYVDPVFLADNPGLTVTVSDGFSNAPPTTASAPEPATLATFALGVAGLRLMRRRRTA